MLMSKYPPCFFFPRLSKDGASVFQGLCYVAWRREDWGGVGVKTKT